MGTRAAPGGIMLLVALLAAALAIMLVMAMLQPVTLFRMESNEGNLLICSRIDPGSPVTLSFTHSMYGGSVNESYVVDNTGTLVRQRIVTDNAAAAEYYAPDGRVRRRADGFEVLASPFSTDELIIRVDRIGDHRLAIGPSTWQVFDMVEKSVQVRLSGERTPRISVPDTCTIPEPGVHTKGLSE